MTAKNPALFLPSPELHPAEDVRRFIAAVAGDTDGVVEADGLVVTERSGTPTMGIDVAGGRAFIAGTQATYQGTYFAENRGVTQLAIAAADSTNPRKDLVVARVYDSDYSGSTREWALEVVAGTPAASPVEPATPDNALVLALIDVPASDTAITNAQITDRRTRARTVEALPRGRLGRAVQSADVTLTTTVATVVSVPVEVEAGRALKIIAKVFSITDADNNANYVSLNLDDSTTVFDAIRIPAQASTDQAGAVVVGDYDTAAAGTITFRLRALTDAGNATLVSAGSGPGAYARALIIVEDTGAA